MFDTSAYNMLMRTLENLADPLRDPVWLDLEPLSDDQRRILRTQLVNTQAWIAEFLDRLNAATPEQVEAYLNAAAEEGIQCSAN